MKKLLILSFLPLWGLGGFAHASVTVTPLSVNYNAKTVTFSVTYSAAYNNRAWVWIDLCPVPGGTPGAFQPAEISAASATVGSVLYASTNTRGFFVTASPATVTATLDNAVDKFNWCAYGSDAPPEAEVLSGGGYKLHGTLPFTINGNLTVNANTFGAGTCIASITDLTGNPDGIAHDIPQATISGAAANPCPATTAVLTAAAANATTFTWYKNGAQVQSGTSASYTVTATDSYTVQGSHANCTGSASEAKSVTISTCSNGTTYSGCITPTIILTGVGFSSSATYSRNGIIMSSPVTVTMCQKTDFSGGTSGAFNNDCRTVSGYAGDLFSWCMVKQFAAVLCPAPWHVPTMDEFRIFANGSASNGSGNTAIRIGSNGYAGGSYCYPDGSMAEGGTTLHLMGQYWSQTEFSADGAYYSYTFTDIGYPDSKMQKNNGARVKCVR
jgi:uncharacterized protein (TIGR02145 family)